MHNPYKTIEEYCSRDVIPVATAVRRFIETTVEFAHGWVALCTMPYDEPPHTLWAKANDQEQLTQLSMRVAMRNVKDRFGVHLCMATRRGQLAAGRGGDKDVLSYPCFWVDVDQGDNILERLRAFRPTPSIISASSPGRYHAVWCLEPAAPYTAVEDRINQNIAVLLGGDTAASKPSSMLRVPGTINTKPERGNLVEIVEWDNSRLYHPRDFARYDPGPEVLRPVMPRVESESADHPVYTAEEVAHMCKRAKPYRDGWLVSCPCPTHGKGKGDRTTSMTVAQGDKGVLVYCFAGCDYRDITQALGLPIGALFSASSRPASRAEMRAMWAGKKR